MIGADRDARSPHQLQCRDWGTPVYAHRQHHLLLGLVPWRQETLFQAHILDHEPRISP